MQSAVKVLYVKRDGKLHSIRELEVSTKIQLNNVKDYISGKMLSQIIVQYQSCFIIGIALIC